MPREIDRIEVQQLLSRGVPVVEVMPAKQYRQMHIAGAVNIPLKTLDRKTAAELDPESPVVVYCFDPQ